MNPRLTLSLLSRDGGVFELGKQKRVYMTKSWTNLNGSSSSWLVGVKGLEPLRVSIGS